MNKLRWVKSKRSQLWHIVNISKNIDRDMIRCFCGSSLKKEFVIILEDVNVFGVCNVCESCARVRKRLVDDARSWIEELESLK